MLFISFKFQEANLSEKNDSTLHIENIPECTSSQVAPHDDSESQNQANQINDNFSSVSSIEDKTYSASAVFSELESTEDKNEQIPKIIIKLKPESQDIDQDFSCTDNSSIANNANSSSVNDESVNLETVKIKVKDKHKHKKHKKKSRHKKKHSLDHIKNKTLKKNKNFNDNMTNCTTESCIDEDLLLNKNADVNLHVNDSQIHVYNQHSDDNSNENLSYADKNFETRENDYMLHDIKTESLDNEVDVTVAEPSVISNSAYVKTEPVWDEMSQNGSNESLAISDSVVIKTESLCDEVSQNGSIEPLTIADAVDFEFEFENADELSLSPSISIKQEKGTSADNFLSEVDASSNENIPCKSVLETVKTEPSTECLEHNGYQKEEHHSEKENESTGKIKIFFFF